jgi:hypothetical protein
LNRAPTHAPLLAALGDSASFYKVSLELYSSTGVGFWQ